MTRYHDDKYGRGIGDRGTPIVAGTDEYTRDRSSNREIYCKWCRFRLSRIIDSSVQNPALYCDRCKISYDDTDDDLRSKNKIANPERIDNSGAPAVSYALDPNAAFHNKPVYEGGVKTLAEKGLRIVSYYDSAKGKVGRKITGLGKRDNDNG